MDRKEILTGYAIVVVDRGFVYIGQVGIDDKWCVITNAQNIRYWGTKRGLGELALNGPQPDTKLDPCGTVRIPFHAVLHLMDTQEALWS
jgi:hypothetical protein